MHSLLANPANHSQPKRPLSVPTLHLVSLNIEGLTPKKYVIAEILREQDCEIHLLQETHRGQEQNTPKINGMTLIIERPHNKYGSAIFVKNNIAVKSASENERNDIEILTVDLGKCPITSIYKPSNESFAFEEPEN